MLVSEHAFGSLVVRKHALDNGLAIVLLRDASAPVVAYQTWFRVGSRHEVRGRTGIAHLFEHLMFNQTVNLPPGEFDRRIEAVGGETNAGTWVDWTCYVTNAPAAALPTLIELESERMQHLLLGDEQVESEREVVMNERRFRVEDSVDGTLNEALYARAFTSHPYHWPTIGWMRDIEAITIEDCRAFYRSFYAPSNATLVVVGDFDERATLAALESTYGPIASAPAPAEPLVTEPAQTAARRHEIEKAVTADRVQLGWPAVGQREASWVTLELVAELLAGGNASRLYRALVVDRELAASVQASLAPFRDPGLFEISVAMRRGHRAEEAERVIEFELASLAAEGPRPGEVEGARARLLTRFWTGLRPQAGKAESLGLAEVTLGDYRRLFEAPQRYAAVDASAVQRVVAAHLVPVRCTTVVARPQGWLP